MPQHAGAQSVLSFWFGDPEQPDGTFEARRKLWFGKSEETDRQIYQQFHSLYAQAATGELDHWQQEPESTLALVLVLDQFPRNMFRDSPQSFATDARAKAVAERAIAHQYDQALTPEQRLFLYLPLEHSENIDDQHRSVALFETLLSEAPHLQEAYDYALRHRDVIERFGRFPHRNEILGRSSTPEEQEFLKQPGSRF